MVLSCLTTRKINVMEENTTQAVRQCINCNSLISDDMRADAKYCSEQCRIEYNIKKRSEKRRNKTTTTNQEPPKQFKPLEESVNIKDLIAEVEKLKALVNGVNETLLTPNQACERLNISRSTLKRYVQKGILTQYSFEPSSTTKQSRVYFKASELLINLNPV
jgi:predicted DNA-binding protein (UPF0251 family)